VTFSRRTILAAATAAVGAGIVSAPGAASSQPARPFSLRYAPHEGSFASRGGLIEQVAFAADQGFRAWEDNTAPSRSRDEQTALALALQSRDMAMGVFVASMPRWAEFQPVLGGDDDAARSAFLADIRSSIDVARRLNARWMTIVPGFADRRTPPDIQTARIIDLMRRAAELVEPHGLVMVMEPLNTFVDHPGVFLRTIAQAFAIARAVDSPAVKILADLYHAQIEAGNLIRSLEACWSEIAYLQFGDNPGRKEPGTGEIHYRNVVQWLREREFSGIVGMEHGNSLEGRPGEARLISAYREVDRR
jgi:hydroxypyruvate isomerase